MSPLQKPVTSRSSKMMTSFDCDSADGFTITQTMPTQMDERASSLVLSRTETFNERLERVKQTFAEFGISKVTLQIEEKGQTCCTIHAGTVSDAEMEPERCSVIRHADQYSIMTDDGYDSRTNICPQA